MQSPGQVLQWYRLLALIGGLLVLLMGIVRRLSGDGDYTDPLWARCLVASINFTVWGASFYVKRVREAPQWIIYVITYTTSVWIVWLMALNGFSVQFGLGYLLVIAVSCLFAINAKGLLAYLTTIALAVTAAVQLTGTDAVTLPFMLAILFSTGAMSYLLLQYRIRLESNVTERDALMGLVFASVSDGIILVDAETKAIVRHNPSALSLFSARSAADLSQLIQPVFPASTEEADGVARPYALATEAGRPFWGDVAVRYIEQGQQTYYLVRVADITERKQHEEAQEAARQAAEQAKQAAEAAARAKSDFLATMSHEIRTPMNGVIGMTTLLGYTPLDDIQQDYVNTIRTSGDALLNIINDVLDFSKIDAGRIELEEHHFDLYECVEDAIDILGPRTAAKQLNIAYSVAEDVPLYLLGDVTRLRQVLVNLLGNAVKFTETGEVVVEVGLAPAASPVGAVMLHLTVRDTGIGIDPSKVDTLFDAFTQADASTTRRYGGTGLGLTISQRLVELMGGRIWVESTLGVGSAFHFTTAVRVQAEPPGAVDQVAQSLSGTRILVVDDYATNRRILQDFLRRYGIQVVTAASGSEALDLLTASPTFDAAILDMQMPHMDGATLAHRIRSSTPMLPLLLLSSMGHTTPEQRRLFDGVMTKPIRFTQLTQRLGACMIAATADDAPTAAAGNEATVPVVAPNAVRLLLAEDNRINQKVAVQTFRRLGYGIDVVANGLEAIAALQRTSYDIVFMDVMMPELDGLEATARIRAGSGPQPWIVALTANAMPEDRERCLAAGMNGYIAKPIKLQALTETLQRWKAAQESAPLTA
ncbi:MAG: response regulator [Bacteroidota bacterium]